MVQQAATIIFMELLRAAFRVNEVVATFAFRLVCGLYGSVSANRTFQPTQRLTGGGGFAIGHQQQFAIG